MTPSKRAPKLRPGLVTLLGLALLPPTLCAAPSDDTATRADAGWILARLARPAPTRTSFLELRGSKLLKTPLRIQGEYLRPDEATLVRQVRAPYVETTTIRAGEVEIARSGKSPRTFSLSRAPELGGLQASFGALLTGDRKLLEQHYRLTTDGSRQAWSMVLTPRDAALAAKVQAITLHGRGAELRCIETVPATAGQRGGDVQRTLLAGAARAAATVTDATALAALCRGDNRG